jgi:ubiquinone/menaquinone biosynthesis C-methylase UbiE
MRRGPTPWFFDAWARVYDLPPVQRVVYRPPQDAVVQALRDVPCRAILDVGCGTGQLAARLRREFRGTRIVGCDFSRGMLRAARARDRRTAWVQGDAGRLPFADGAFDALVSTEAFHWFPEPGRALAEFRRVLSPTGRLLLALVNPRLAVTGRLVELGSRILGQPMRWPTRGELRDLLRAAGFQVDRQVPILRLPGALLLPPALTVATIPRAESRAPRARSMVL